MSILERFELSYAEHGIGNLCAGNKYVWAAEEVFGMFTYDDEMSEFFVKEIFEVIDAIYARINFTYINDNNKYAKYLQVCLMLDQFGWIEWGSSIRGAWLERGPLAKDIIEGVPFTPQNLIILMNFVEEGEENGRTQNP